MAVETFCVICTIMRRHPELHLSKQEELNIGKIMDEAVNLYALRYALFFSENKFNLITVRHNWCII